MRRRGWYAGSALEPKTGTENDDASGDSSANSAGGRPAVPCHSFTILMTSTDWGRLVGTEKVVLDVGSEMSGDFAPRSTRIPWTTTVELTLASPSIGVTGTSSSVARMISAVSLSTLGQGNRISARAEGAPPITSVVGVGPGKGAAVR